MDTGAGFGRWTCVAERPAASDQPALDLKWGVPHLPFGDLTGLVEVAAFDNLMTAYDIYKETMAEITAE